MTSTITFVVTEAKTSNEVKRATKFKHFGKEEKRTL